MIFITMYHIDMIHTHIYNYMEKLNFQILLRYKGVGTDIAHFLLSLL